MKTLFFPLTLSTAILVTSLPLPNVVGTMIFVFFNLYATNLATSNTLPPPTPIILEKFESENSDWKTNHIIRIYYANSHYSSVRPNGQGGHLFNFQVLQPGDLQKQIALLQEADKPQKDIISDNSLSDKEKAKEHSKVIAEAFDNYLRFYATRLIK